VFPTKQVPPVAQVSVLVVKSEEVTEVSDVEAKVRVYVPAVLCHKFVNVATPLTAVTVVVPPNVPPEAVTVTDADEWVTVLPTASTMRTTG
jgi:oxalate decarboxylase/phosphoglucose isomerase-like protein (cupin superfamily)